MSKQKQTLFEKLNLQDAFRSVESNTKIRSSKYLRILILLSTLLSTTLIFNFHLENDQTSASNPTVSEGRIWYKKALVSEIDFPVLKDKEVYESEKEKAREETKPVFEYRNYVYNDVIENLSSLIDTNNNNFKIILSDMKDKVDSKVIQNKVEKILRNLYNKGIISLNRNELDNRVIVISDDKNISYEKSENVLTVSEGTDFLIESLNKKLSKQISDYISDNSEDLIIPNFEFSEDLTEKRRDLAVDNIARTEGIIEKGQILAEKGDRLNKKQVNILKSYFNSLNIRNSESNSYLMYLGSLGHVSVIFLLFVIYLYNIRKRIFKDNFQLLILCIMFFLTALLAWLSLEINSQLKLEYMIIIPAFAMLSAIIFDSRTAFYFVVSISFLAAGVRGNDYSVGLTHLFSGAVAAYTVRDIQNRTQMFRSIFYILLGYIISIAVFALERSTPTEEILDTALIIASNSVLSPLITFGIIFLLENISNFSTDLKLKEYDNLDHPLLKKLSDVAPGTYQHSLNVAMLAERCAIAIGANPIFCKVSSLYHDIGKMKRPEYFVENQIDIDNKHEKLSPQKSAKSIIEHVTYGVKLAREYNLPERLIDVILMHHGTTLVQYFYAKALEEDNPKKEVKEEDFRYPGPAPNTKEAALIMICDSAEAISHIKNFTSEELDNIVQKVINDRILDGQFEHCNITLQELQIIKFTVVKNLIGMGHKRIQYKEVPKTIKTDYGYRK